MVTYWQPFAIEEHADALGASSDVVRPPGHQSHCVFVQGGHFKLGEVRHEGDASVFLSIKRFDAGIPRPAHVVVPSLTWRYWDITYFPFKFQ